MCAKILNLSFHMKIFVCLVAIPGILLSAAGPSTVTVSSSANPSVYGSAVTLTATVTPSTATGLVTFYDGVTVLGTSALASGQATFSTKLLASGGRSLKAYYEGDSADLPSTSTVVAQTVLPVGSSGMGAPVNYPAGSGPWGIAVADFNLDGKVDIAVADNQTSNTSNISVLLGKGDGTFQNALSASAGTAPINLAAGDFNGDGKPDLAVVSTTGLTILLGNGDGTFQSPANYESGAGAQYIAVADFNEDGKPDLVVANDSPVGAGASVLLGNGDGTFQAPVSLSAGAPSLFVAVADFNLDGNPDIVVTTIDSTSVFLGNGDGTFKSLASILYFTPGAVGDFNGDGIPDLAAVDGYVAYVALGHGDGTFSTTSFNYYYGGPTIAAVGDFNGDGKPDLAAPGVDGLIVLLGNGDGTFQSAAAYTTGDGPDLLATADFNGDGRADIAATEEYGNQVGVLLGVSAGIQDLTISKSHAGHFTPGQTGATWTITVSNVGGSYTSGTVSMVDTLPAGITATAISGTGWNCVLATVTCTRSDALLAFDSYPPITLTVNVASNAALLITNTATVSGGGETNTANDTATDLTYVTTAATPTITAITNAADGATGSLAPGSIATITGTALASATAQASTPPLPTTLANVNVTVNGMPASIELVSPGQINFQVPYEVPTYQDVNVVVSNEQTASAPFSIYTYAEAPYIFPGTIQNANAGTNSASNPAAPGSAITVFFTGAGAVMPTVADGAAAPSSPPAVPISTFTAYIGNSIATVSSTMLAPGLVGVAQATITIPTALEAGSYNLTIGDSPSATVYVGGPAPAITSLFPNNLPAGSGATEIAINGSNFGETPSVSFTAPGGQVTSLSVNSNEPSQLTAYLPASLLSTAGIAKITTSNSLGVSSNSLPFYITPFTVSTVSPNRGTAGSGATQVTVTGQNLGTATSLSFTPPGGSATSISLSQIQSTQVQATIPATLLKSAGTAQIAVANSAGALSNSLLFTIVPSLPATTTSLTSSVNPSEFGHSVTLTATVSPSTATGNVTFLDGTTILETVPVTSGQAALTTTLLAADKRSLKAFYGGDANDAPSLSTTVAQTVSALPDTNGFAAPLNDSVLGYYGAYGTAVGDFNRDGIPDLAVQGLYSPNNLSILLGKGDGTFQTPVGYAAGYSIQALAVGDFNGDGIPDLVALDGDDDGYPTLSVFPGNGDGTFQAPLNYSSVVGISSVIAVADFNGDGKADLVLSASSGVAVLLGNGDGTFQTPLEILSGNIYVSQVAVGDFNGDGTPDLALGSDDYDGVTVLLGNGDGTFQPGVQYAPDSDAYAMVAADFNGDGKTDLALEGYESVTILLAGANGGFQTPVSYPTGYSNYDSLVEGDFNGDGSPDLLIGSGQVLYGNGDGTFQPAVTLTAAIVGNKPVVADFNGDGRPDVAYSEYGSAIYVLLGVPKLPDLSIALTNATVFVEGQTGAAYTITVSNTGSAPTTGEVTVMDALPAGLTATNIAGTGWACTLATLTCTRSDALAVSASYPAITLTVNVAASAPSIVTNVATVTGGGETNTANDTASVNTNISNETFQSITFGTLSNITFGAAPFAVSATASSGLTVTFTSGSSGVCTVTGATVTIVGGGTCSITASQSGNGTYAAATPVTQTFTVNPEAQTISFGPLSAITLPASPFAVSATASSGLGVSFSTTSTGVCTVNGATVTPISSGTCSITASQPGNANYASATQVTQSFTINPAPNNGGGGSGGGGGGVTVPNTLTSSPASLTLSATANGPSISQSVTLTYMTSYEGAPSFSGTVTMNQGSGWLSLSPGTINTTQASFNGSVYTYTATITIGANPAGLSAGSTYTGSIGFSVYGATLSIPVTLNVTTAPKFTVTPQSLSFTYQSGASTVPAAQSLSVFTQPSGLSFTATASSNGNWLGVSSTSSPTPGSVGVSVSVGSLTAGTYQGTVAVASGSTSVSVPVTLTITAAPPPQLAVSPSMQTLSLPQGSTSASGQVVVSNNGGGTLQFTAQAATDQGSWLTLTGSGSGSATPSSPASVPFTVNPSGLGAGVYAGSITVTGGGMTGSARVILTVLGSGESIQLSQTGMSFTAVAGGAEPPSQTFLVAPGPSITAIPKQVSNPLSEKTWLQVSTPVSGATGTSATVSVDTSLLPAGQYYGSVNVTAADAVNSPQVVTVALNVLPSSSTPGETVSTGGVLLFGIPGSTTPVQQTVTIFNPSTASTSYSASTFTANGSNWLSVSPASGTAASGETSIAIAANLSGLTSGVQSGTVRLVFGDGSNAAIQVFVLVMGSTTSSPSLVAAKLRAASVAPACSGGKASFLIPVFLLPSAQSVIPAAVPATLQVEIIDDCGNPVTAANGGSVQVAFSNGDAGLNLQDAGGGVWQGTWTPVNSGNPVTLQIAASEQGLAVNPALGLGTTTVAVTAVNANSPPQPTGIANAASGGQAIPEVVAPGSYVAIYGTGLGGSGTPSATTLPLPTTLNGVQLLLGGIPMPLLYAGTGQVNAIVPQELSPNASYPLVVVRGSAQSAPVPLTVTELQPGVYSVNAIGTGQGIVTNATTGQIVNASNPAHAGDYLTIYCTGLGALTGPNGQTEPADGAAAPLSPLFQTTATVTATIGGATAPVSFAGLTPTLAALYQVNVQVPASAPTGDSVALVITATDAATGATAQSNSVSIAVQ